MSTETELTPEQVEALAEAAHQVWMESKLFDGWKFGLETDKDRKIHACLIPYDELSEADKESDRALVRGIPQILAVAGYIMVKSGVKDLRITETVTDALAKEGVTEADIEAAKG